MSTLTVNTKAVAYGDPKIGNNPLRKHFDWTRGMSVSVKNPKSDREENLPAGGSHTFFNGTRSTSIDGTTAFSVTQSPTEPSRYRFTWTGGTNPVLRTDRALSLAGQALAIEVNSDQTVNMSLDGGSWGSTAAGDLVFLPGVSTGDAPGAVNVMNEGFWVVLAVLSATEIQCERPSGEDFQASAEAVPITDEAQVQAFSPTGILAGDKVSIGAGFAASTQKTFTIDKVTAKWFEVVSTTSVPLESGKTPGATGMVFYTNSKAFLRLEADQEVVVRINGSTADHVRVSPFQAGDVEQIGWLELSGPIWTLTVINKSSQPATVDIFSAE